MSLLHTLREGSTQPTNKLLGKIKPGLKLRVTIKGEETHRTRVLWLILT